ncbi:MAG TPA: AlkA N-terminal domain-containing protein [Longimicrobiaceae bacterium]|nr:AlkA N-terminal domain-containing protein [Longimicrobiaceae bacterium]
MTDDQRALYNAYASRDRRFDGVFFVGVTSTGIYCRPVCTARTPRVENCRFFPNAAMAEQAKFRPCLKCRPELAPGNALVDSSRRAAHRIAIRIAEGMLDSGARLEEIAAEFHMSSRQIRRVVKKEMGVSPMELVMTRRLLLAKQLLTETELPIIRVAYSSGFASLRRFNDAFSKRYGMAPSRLRGKAGNGNGNGSGSGNGGKTAGHGHGHDVGVVRLKIGYREPFDWAGLLGFLAPRAMSGVEATDGEVYYRTVAFGEVKGWVAVRNSAPDRALVVEMPEALTESLPELLSRLRTLFDLDARPDVIASHLEGDPRLRDTVRRNPGLRVPGSFDGFEVAVRAILGQQVTVKGATTLAGRYAEAFGEPIESPHPNIRRLSPTPERVAALEEADLRELGIVGSRARTIIDLAREVTSGRLHLSGSSDPEGTMDQLMDLPGIGPWTANYIAMRAFNWPDAFPAADLAIRKRLGGVTPKQAEAISQQWRPWRSYAAMHLWSSAAPQTS